MPDVEQAVETNTAQGFVGPVTAGIQWPFPPLNPQIDWNRTTAKLMVITYTPVPGCGYRYSVDGKVVSSTWNEAQKEVRFGRPQDGQQHVYEIEPVLIGPGEKVQH